MERYDISFDPFTGDRGSSIVRDRDGRYVLLNEARLIIDDLRAQLAQVTYERDELRAANHAFRMDEQTNKEDLDAIYEMCIPLTEGDAQDYETTVAVVQNVVDQHLRDQREARRGE